MKDRNPLDFEARLNVKVFDLLALNKAAQVLTSILELQPLAEMAVDIVAEMGKSADALLYLRDDSGAVFKLAAAKMIERGQLPSELGSETSLVRTAQQTKGRPFLGEFRWLRGEVFVLPLHLREQVLGLVLVSRRQPSPWVADDIEFMETLSAQISLCVQNARLYQQLKDRLEELQRTQAQLLQTEKLTAMGELLAGVAHELNNPLSLVIGQALLLCRAVGGGELAERAEKIVQAADRCARIVKNFLALARQQPPERQKLRLNQIVEEAVELLAYLLQVDDVKVKLDLAPNLPVLWADSHQLHQVVVNFITNAHQAMREARPPRELTLTTRFDLEHRWVSLEVADTGPGIPPEIQARIFEPFFTTKPAGQGTGLGLSLCQGIVEAHGGTIRVESLPSRGATFIVELPVQAVPEVVTEAPEAEAPAPVVGKAILVVDDEPGIAEMLAEMLAADGHQVETAANGARALEKLHERDYDLILSDLKMPELDGPGFYREVERLHPSQTSRFVFLTGDVLSQETRQFLEETRAPSLSKPFAPEEIRRVVQHALWASGADSPASRQ